MRAAHAHAGAWACPPGGGGGGPPSAPHGSLPATPQAGPRCPPVSTTRSRHRAPWSPRVRRRVVVVARLHCAGGGAGMRPRRPNAGRAAVALARRPHRAGPATILPSSVFRSSFDFLMPDALEGGKATYYFWWGSGGTEGCCCCCCWPVPVLVPARPPPSRLPLSQPARPRARAPPPGAASTCARPRTRAPRRSVHPPASPWAAWVRVPAATLQDNAASGPCLQLPAVLL